MLSRIFGRWLGGVREDAGGGQVKKSETGNRAEGDML